MKGELGDSELWRYSVALVIFGQNSHPERVIDRYLEGDALTEAYWKSVAQPGQGFY